MPPKTRKTAKKRATATKKARATPAAKAAVETTPVVQEQVPEKAKGSKKRRAESVSEPEEEERSSKKAKVDKAPAVDAREPRELDASLKVLFLKLMMLYSTNVLILIYIERARFGGVQVIRPYVALNRCPDGRNWLHGCSPNHSRRDG